MEIFVRKWSEISGGRFDPTYHKDEYTNLERTIKSKSNLTLRDFIISISSGATPDKNNAHLYYTNDAQSGIPFLRVQNIKPDSTISNDFIYITKQTHEGLLQRSQVTGGDLIVTITGRLATAAVAPQGFVGNINQHSVVIKTKDFKTSQTLATYLNTSIGEKLALRRATGGTRPALDYIALKSIPIVYNESIVEIIENVNKEKRRKESEAQAILDSIDDFLLGELGISLPPKATSDLKERIFFVNLSEISGTRFDAEYHQHYYTQLQTAIHQGKYEVVSVSSVIKNIKKGIEVGSNEYTKEKQTQEIPFVRVSDITSNGINFESVDKFIMRSLYENLKADFQPKENELLYSKDGTIGICLESDSTRQYIISGAIVRLMLHSSVNRVFFQNLISLNAINELTNREAIGAVIKHLTIDKFLNLKIPLPPLSVQESIAEEISRRKNKALSLQQEAKSILDSAKSTIEQIILN